MTEPIAYPLPPAPSIYQPSPELMELQRDRPVARVRLAGGGEAWLVSRYADVRRVLTDRRFSRAAADQREVPAEGIGDVQSQSLVGMDPPEHTRIRRLVARAFTPRRVEELRPRVAGRVDQLLDAMAALPRPVDLHAHLASLLPAWVISELLGIREEDRERCRTWSDTLIRDWDRDPEGASAALDGFAALLAARRATPGDDLISAMIAARDRGERLSDRELLMVGLGLLLGGHESTTSEITLFVLTLLRHREHWERIVARPADIPAAVEELMRFVQLGSNGESLPRRTTEDVVLGGVRIPAGALVLPAYLAANRDPAVFADPDRFDPDRPSNPHLGFGAGIHHCLGAQLARMELQEVLRGLARRMPGLRLAVAESELRYLPGLAVRRLAVMPVTW